TSLDQLGDNDRRRDMPRFQGDNLDANLSMVNAFADIAASKGVSAAALAIAWVLARGDDVVPIPGCSRRDTLKDSLTALEVELSKDEMTQIENAIDAGRIIGTRYPEKQMARLGI
ncbi:MAG: aldo/keto reductase, partial [Gammaproteobacteria bacterium]|nr:aldo/keto reductase [Gammaproteobacteria bacterium]